MVVVVVVCVNVFPAHAGMSLDASGQCKLAIRFPRSRGDEPYTSDPREDYLAFSPLTRG